MVEAIRSRDLYQVAGRFGNVLELVTESKYPVIGELKQAMKETGALNALMSGSGPTVFGLYASPKAARNAYEALRYGRYASLAKQVYLTNLFNNSKPTR